jgi:hypothetical protein
MPKKQNSGMLVIFVIKKKNQTSTSKYSCFVSFFGAPFCFFFWRPALRRRLTNRHWSKLRSQRSASTLASNQLLPNTSLKRDEKALIDLVDGLFSRSIVLVNVTDGDLTDHDMRLEGKAIERLPGHGDQVQAIATTFLIVI